MNHYFLSSSASTKIVPGHAAHDVPDRGGLKEAVAERHKDGAIEKVTFAKVFDKDAAKVVPQEDTVHGGAEADPPDAEQIPDGPSPESVPDISSLDETDEPLSAVGGSLAGRRATPDPAGSEIVATPREGGVPGPNPQSSRTPVERDDVKSQKSGPADGAPMNVQRSASEPAIWRPAAISGALENNPPRRTAPLPAVPPALAKRFIEINDQVLDGELRVPNVATLEGRPAGTQPRMICGQHAALITGAVSQPGSPLDTALEVKPQKGDAQASQWADDTAALRPPSPASPTVPLHEMTQIVNENRALWPQMPSTEGRHPLVNFRAFEVGIAENRKSVSRFADPPPIQSATGQSEGQRPGGANLALPQDHRGSTVLPSRASVSYASAAGMIPAPRIAAAEPDIQPLTSREVAVEVAYDSQAAPAKPSAVTSASQPRPELPVHVARQLAEAALNNGARQVDIALSPEELGRVRLSVTPGENGISVSILAERAETLELMRRNIDQLGQEFQSLGYRNIAFSFANGQQSGGDSADHARDDDSGNPSAVPDGSLDRAPEIHIGPNPTTGVDLRL